MTSRDEDGKLPEPVQEKTPTKAERKAQKREANAFRIRGRVVFGTLVMCGILMGIGGWAATAELSGAVIASGSVVVDKNVKKIQHRDGGIISKIHVKNGDHVKAGQVILELDDVQIRAELGVVRAQLTELIARKARLSAEINGLQDIVFPEAFEGSSSHASHVAKGERRLFTETQSNIDSQIEQLKLQIVQLQDEIAGIKSQQEAKHGQLKLVKAELDKINYLYEKKLTSATRIYGLQREEKRLWGEHGGLTAQIARSKGKISEINLEILSVTQTSRLQAQKELRTIEAKVAELSERAIAAEDRLARTRLYAPQNGTVHELAVHTIGGVITAAETAIVIVPENDRLTIEVKIDPVNIDQVTVGRSVNVRFSAFHQETTPEITGRVVNVSADVTTDARTSQSYYLGRIEVVESSKLALSESELELLPGMPVEVFISTGARTALSYLAKPITDQFHRAFREE